MGFPGYAGTCSPPPGGRLLPQWSWLRNKLDDTKLGCYLCGLCLSCSYLSRLDVAGKAGEVARLVTQDPGPSLLCSKQCLPSGNLMFSTSVFQGLAKPAELGARDTVDAQAGPWPAPLPGAL